MASVPQFIATYVPEGDRVKAESAMCDLFVQMHSDLARKFFTEYNKHPVVQMAVNLNEEVPKPVAVAAATTEKKLCGGMTAKGKTCGNKCFGGGEYCKVHQKVADKAVGVVPKKKAAVVGAATKKVKPQKVIPVHNHALTEEVVEDCPLCDTQGNAMNPELPAAEFEAVLETGVETENIQTRLAGILAQFDEEEEEVEEEEEEETHADPDITDEEEETRADPGITDEVALEPDNDETHADPDITDEVAFESDEDCS